MAINNISPNVSHIYIRSKYLSGVDKVGVRGGGGGGEGCVLQAGALRVFQD